MSSLKAVVNTDGTVGEVVLIRRVDRDLDVAALEAVRKFQFNPTTLMGVPVRTLTNDEKLASCEVGFVPIGVKATVLRNGKFLFFMCPMNF